MESLNEAHRSKISDFKCQDIDGNNQVELFLKEQAINLMERNLVRTKVFLDNKQTIVGFYSLFNDTVKMHKNKRGILKVHLPQNVTEIPAVRLHF